MIESFSEDRAANVDAPELNDRPRRYRNNTWRHIPPRPRGLYAQYLDELIERNRAKRDAAADDEYWNRRWEYEAMTDLPHRAA
jgi:hypothetical protein